MIRSPAWDSYTHTHTQTETHTLWVSSIHQWNSTPCRLWRYLRVLPGGDEVDLQFQLALMLLINLKSQQFTSFHAASGVNSGGGSGREGGEGQGGEGQGGEDGGGGAAHIKNMEVVVNQVLHDLHLMLSLAVRLEEAGSEEQCQVLGTHLVQVGTFLDPGGCKGSAGRVQLGLVYPLGILTKSKQNLVLIAHSVLGFDWSRLLCYCGDNYHGTRSGTGQ